MKFSMMGQEKCVFLTEVTSRAGLTVYTFADYGNKLFKANNH
jgi:hypothetical protein